MNQDKMNKLRNGLAEIKTNNPMMVITKQAFMELEVTEFIEKQIKIDDYLIDNENDNLVKAEELIFIKQNEVYLVMAANQFSTLQKKKIIENELQKKIKLMDNEIEDQVLEVVIYAYLELCEYLQEEMKMDEKLYQELRREVENNYKKYNTPYITLSDNKIRFVSENTVIKYKESLSSLKRKDIYGVLYF